MDTGRLGAFVRFHGGTQPMPHDQRILKHEDRIAELSVSLPDWIERLERPSVWRGAPSIGQDTTDILSRLLNLDAGEIARLYEGKAVHRTEPFLTPQVDAVRP